MRGLSLILSFLVQRLYRHELLKDEEIEFARMMENKYPEEYECSKHVAAYIEKEYGSQDMPVRKSCFLQYI